MKRLLIIDEDAGERRLLARSLGEQGWHVSEAADSAEGLRLAREQPPEVVLCSVVGARSGGSNACRRLRHEPPTRHARIIALARAACDCDQAAALEAGADACLAKPVSLPELQAALAAFAGGADARPATPVSGALENGACLRFWGVRGSTPTPGPTTVRYGGNTSCLEFRAEGEIIILDAGTGLRPLGRALGAEFHGRPLRATLLLTHTHWDHIHGLPYFLPIYKPDTQVRILGYEGAKRGLASILMAQMESPYFPVGFQSLPSSVVVEELKDLEFQVGRVRVHAMCANHPGMCVGYRLFTRHGSVAFFPDHEMRYNHRTLPPHPRCPALNDPAGPSLQERLAGFLRGVEVLVIDAQYTTAEYQEHVGWGHGCVDDVVDLGLAAGARMLFLFHHDPDHDDAQIAGMVEAARQRVAERGGGLIVEAAREGVTVGLPLEAAVSGKLGGLTAQARGV